LHCGPDESEPLRAIKDVLDRAVSKPATLPPFAARARRDHALHVSPDLTVIKVVWAPGMRLWPHDHRMWAAIGIYTGGEDNEFFRRNATSLVGIRRPQPRAGRRLPAR